MQAKHGVECCGLKVVGGCSELWKFSEGLCGGFELVGGFSRGWIELSSNNGLVKSFCEVLKLWKYRKYFGAL
jgi:hypothetical protein